MLRFLILGLAMALVAVGCADAAEKRTDTGTDLGELPAPDVTTDADTTTDAPADSSDVGDVPLDVADTAMDMTSDQMADQPGDTTDTVDDTTDTTDTTDMADMTEPCGDGTCDATEQMLAPSDMGYCPADCGVLVVVEVDVSGNQQPLPALTTLPPPGGSGTAFVTGDQPVWGPWMPNTVALADDGVPPDTMAADGLWTGGFVFDAGTVLLYKYTIGNMGDGWVGTEEFAAGNDRGYVVPSDGTAQVRIRDVFANQPASSGQQGPLTTIVVEAP